MQFKSKLLKVLFLITSVFVTKSFLRHHVKTGNTQEELAIEDIKDAILKQLEIRDRPPRYLVKRSLVLPQPIFQESRKVVDQDEYSNSKLVLLPKRVSNDVSLEVTFKMDSTVCKGQLFSRSLLSVYKGRKNDGMEELVFALFVNRTLVQRKNFSDDSSKWISFDVTNVLKHCEDRKYVFRIVCENCLNTHGLATTVDEYMPHITIHTFSGKRIVRKRRNTCRNQTSCCKRHLYVNFTDIQWSDWVVSPEGFTANYCGGKCEGTQLRKAIGVVDSCCTATEKGALTLNFRQKDVIYQKVFHNLVTLACGCT